MKKINLLKSLPITFVFIFQLFILPLNAHSETVTGFIVDGATSGALEGVAVSIFESEGGALLASSTTNESGIYLAENIPNGIVYITCTIADYIATFGNFTIQETTETYSLGTVMLAPASEESGIINGRIIDASTDDTFIPTVSLSLLEGINQTTGTAIDSQTSADADSVTTYEFTDVAPGSYTLLAQKAGYANSFINVVSTGGSTKTFQISMSSDITAEGGLRIVLSWNEHPRDIDSHLITPAIEGESYHVYYADPGSLENAPYAGLDRDDVTSYGPETVTIDQFFPGIYRYSVKYFAGEGALATSGAIVKVYDINGLLHTFNVPPTVGSIPSEFDDEWVVFSLDGNTGEITSSSGEILVPDEELTPVVSTVPPQQQGGSNTGCFIATAAFGSPMENHVMTLRAFRDQYLLPNKLGRIIIGCYYKYSPPLANYIAKHNTLRTLTRICLLSFIVTCTFMAHYGMYMIIFGCFLLIALLIALYLIKKESIIQHIL